MKGKGHCTLCGGSGSYHMDGDLHRSGGMVPCHHDPDKPRERVKINPVKATRNALIAKAFKNLRDKT